MGDGQGWAAELIDTAESKHPISELVQMCPKAVKWHDGIQWQVGHELQWADNTPVLTACGNRLVICLGEIYAVDQNRLQSYPPRKSWEVD